MPTSVQLLESLTSSTPSMVGAICTTLGEMLSALSRSFFESDTPVSKERLTPDHCLVLESSQVHSYHISGSRAPKWASYEDICRAFELRNERRKSGDATSRRKTSVLTSKLVNSTTKLLIRDLADPLGAVVTSERVYPKRAWVATLHHSLHDQEVEWAYVIAGLLNSAVAWAQYRSHIRNESSRSRELRGGILQQLRVPLVGYDESVFLRVATLSFRLHCLYEAVSTERLPSEVVDIDIRNHWLQLLSELVRLYGYSEPEVKKLVEEALPRGRRDVLGFQSELYYVPRSPLLPIRLLGTQERDRYEQLKERARKGTAGMDAEELARIQRVLRWEALANGGIPHRLVSTPWPGLTNERQVLKAASNYLSRKRGQSYAARNPRRVDQSTWEVDVIHAPMPGDGAGVTSLPASSKLGTLRVDSITGRVSGNCEGTQNAACS